MTKSNFTRRVAAVAVLAALMEPSVSTHAAVRLRAREATEGCVDVDESLSGGGVRDATTIERAKANFDPTYSPDISIGDDSGNFAPRVDDFYLPPSSDSKPLVDRAATGGQLRREQVSAPPTRPSRADLGIGQNGPPAPSPAESERLSYLELSRNIFGNDIVAKKVLARAIKKHGSLEGAVSAGELTKDALLETAYRSFLASSYRIGGNEDAAQTLILRALEKHQTLENAFRARCLTVAALKLQNLTFKRSHKRHITRFLPVTAPAMNDPFGVDATSTFGYVRAQLAPAPTQSPEALLEVADARRQAREDYALEAEIASLKSEGYDYEEIARVLQHAGTLNQKGKPYTAKTLRNRMSLFLARMTSTTRATTP